MDGYGIGIFAMGTIFYYLTKKNKFWLFVMGVGAGVFIGAIWSYLIVMRILG